MRLVRTTNLLTHVGLTRNKKSYDTVPVYPKFVNMSIVQLATVLGQLKCSSCL